MKGWVVAAAVLLAVCILVGVNGFYVRHTTRELMADMEALPAVPDPETTPAEVAALREKLDSHLTGLGLSVSYTVLDRAIETLYSLEANARVGDHMQYAASLALLRDMLEDIARLERFRLENIL